MITLYSYIKTPLGEVLLVFDGKYLTNLMFKGQKHMPRISVEWKQDPKFEVFLDTDAQLQEYFDGTRKQFDLPMRTTGGTPFQQKVWRAIVKIPYGTTTSYQELAKSAGSASSVRAVATAAGKNPLSIIIPCHRIVGITGELSGYSGGIPRKNALITLEQRAVSKKSK